MSNITFRKLMLYDSKIVFHWISNDTLRRMTGTRGKPTNETHKIWMENKLNEKNNLTYVILEDNIPVGLIGTNEIDEKQHNANMYIYVGEINKRKNGVGYRAVIKFIEILHREREIHKITAKVFSYNVVSVLLFNKCRFQLEGIQKDQVFYNDCFYDVFLFGIINTQR